MLARGCAANGARTILIDVNEQALRDMQKEVDDISSAAANAGQHSTYAAPILDTSIHQRAD